MCGCILQINKFLCFLWNPVGGVLLSGLQGNDKSLVRWRWKPLGHTASKYGLHELPAYLERIEQSSKARLLWAGLIEFLVEMQLCALLLSQLTILLIRFFKNQQDIGISRTTRHGSKQADFWRHTLHLCITFNRAVKLICKTQEQ